MNRIARNLLIGGLSTCCIAAAAATVDDFVAQIYTNTPGRLPYRLFIPTNYNPSLKYPLVLFMHGSGESGTDNRLQLTVHTGALAFVSAANQSRYPSFMVAPQCPVNGSWNDSVRRLQLFGLMNLLMSQYSIDSNRLYVTGLSLGGDGTWDQVARSTNMYAAAIPMSAEDNSALASRLINTPTWNFHAANDPVVNVSGSRNTIRALRRAGGNPIYTEYASGNHEIWTPAYNTPVLMDWVYSQKRGATSTNEPLLSITSPTADPMWRTGSTNLNLAGTAGAVERAVTSVSWTNFANNLRGVATGSNLWSVTGIPLQANRTNVIAVVATTTSWSSANGGTTTFNDTLTVVQSPIRATLELQGTVAVLDWEGGGPPYRVQQSTNLPANDWIDYLTNAAPPIPLPQTGHAGFYRIIGE